MAKKLQKNKMKNLKKVKTRGDKVKTVKNNTQKMRVLIADDDERFRESLEALFQKEGFEVICTDATDPSIESIRNEGPFNVIVLDMYMPQKCGESLKPDAGLEATRLLKQYADIDKTVILVVLTGYPKVKDCFAAIDAGAYYLPKCVLDVEKNIIDMSDELVRFCKKLIEEKRDKRTLRPNMESHYSELVENFPGQAIAVLDKNTNVGNLKTVNIGECKVLSAPTVEELKSIILQNPLLRKAMPLILHIWEEKY